MFKLTFTEAEMHIIGTALEQMPFRQVAALINNINKQIQEAPIRETADGA